MRLLVDTRVLLWWLADDRRLSAAHRELLINARNVACVSSVSIAEVSIKTSLGKLAAPANITEVVTASGFAVLEFSAAHAERLRDLPWHHRDPFDRMLIAQAQAEGLTIVTLDRRI